MDRCCKCLAIIEEGEPISYLNNKYKISNEKVCESCVDRKTYANEKELDKAQGREE